MARSELIVSLYGTPVWELRRAGRELSVALRREAVERWSLGSRVMSISMPLSDSHQTGSKVTWFFDSLLPEVGREQIAAAFGLSDLDPFSLLGAIGQDCAGALTISPGLAVEPSSPSSRPLDHQSLDSLIRELPRHPLGLADVGVRHSLAGLQGKLLLLRAPDGSWMQPLGGQPSTHILKPEPMDLPFGTAGNEVFCTRLAQRCGLTDVDAELIEVGGRYIFVTSRFDRRHVNGVVERIHQEDLCQVFSRHRADKYERPGERRLGEAARMLSRFAARSDVLDLLRMTTFNVAVGNTDAHSKNISILHAPNGDVRLAPLYDVACLVMRAGQPVDLAMAINGVSSIHQVAVDDLVAEAVSWKARVNAAQARSAILEVLASMRAESREAEATVWVDEEVVETVATRVSSLLDGLRAGDLSS
jgi:serine/threonine-protein kinase HipA